MESILLIMDHANTFMNGTAELLNQNLTFDNSSGDAPYIKEPLPYYGESLRNFRTSYLYVHGYLTFIVCIFGITANVLNITVLTRKSMISPTNAILTGLAVSDMLVMATYLPFTFHHYIRKDLTDQQKLSYGWGAFTLFHAHSFVLNHTASAWLTVTVAVWRYMMVSFPTKNTVICSMFRAKLAILFTYVTCFIVCIPSFLTFVLTKVNGTDGEVQYMIVCSEISQKDDKILEKINFWMMGVLSKIVPCLALTVLSLSLIRFLYEANLRREKLQNSVENDGIHDRRTKMLLAVLLLFLITEVPHGLVALLSGILDPDFFENVYLNFGEFFDMLSLVNSTINFIIYCTMSRQFRYTFQVLFIPKWVQIFETAQSTETPHH